MAGLVLYREPLPAVLDRDNVYWKRFVSPDVRVVLVGKLPRRRSYRDALQSFFYEEGFTPADVVFTGHVDHAELLELDLRECREDGEDAARAQDRPSCCSRRIGRRGIRSRGFSRGRSPAATGRSPTTPAACSVSESRASRH